MLIIPEVQIQDGKVVTNATAEGSDSIFDITPLEAIQKFTEGGAKMLQIVDIDAARSQPQNNEVLIRQLIQDAEIPVQVSGGIRTLNQINDWFEAGAARVVLGTVAITDAPLVVEAANRHPGGIIVHLPTREGFVTIDGWKTQTAFRPQDLILELQMTGIAGIIHKGTDLMDDNFDAGLALTEELSHEVSIPVYSSGAVRTLDDIARLKYLPNINGAIISHALIAGDILLADALDIAAQKDTSLEPGSVTPNVKMGIHHGVRAYLAAYNSSQATLVWNLALRDTITSDNPYMEITIPQVDLDVDVNSMSPRELQTYYEAELDKADIVIVILDGIENQSWTGFECGYARAKGKYIYGVTASTDISQATHNQRRFASMCDELIYYDAGDDLNISHSEISHALASRVMVQNQ